MTRQVASKRALRAALVLAGLALVLLLSGCGSGGELRDRYVAEKMAWRVRQLERAVRLNPELDTDEMRSRIVDGYRRIADAYPPPEDPAGLSRDGLLIASIAGRARLALATALADGDDTSEAIRLAQTVRERYSFDRALAVDSALTLARFHVAAGEWEEAVTTYASIAEDLEPAVDREAIPDTRILRAPLRVALGYQLREDAERSAEWFTKARRYYRRLAQEWEGTPTAEVAMGILAEAYTYEKRWREAADTYEAFDERYGREDNRATLWIRLAELYERRLARPDRAREYYERVVEAYPDDVASATAGVALAQRALGERRFDDAREWLGRVLESFREDEAVAATAHHHIALSYELEGRWDSAVPEYQAVARDYPTTMYGLAALLHIADRYREVGEERAAQTAYEQAAEQYERIARDYVATGAEVAARNYLIETRLKQERWKDAADALLEASTMLSDSPAAPEMLYQAADLYQTRLGDRAAAAAALRRIVSVYPESDWAEPAAARLETLGG